MSKREGVLRYAGRDGPDEAHWREGCDARDHRKVLKQSLANVPPGVMKLIGYGVYVGRKT
jgi:hypothetical protein